MSNFRRNLMKSTPAAPRRIKNNEVWYTTTDGEKISSGYFANAVNQTKEGDTWIAEFANDITSLQYAFQYVDTLQTLTLPNSIDTLYGSSITNCDNLISIDLPSGLRTMKGICISQCSSLIELNIPNTVSSIENLAIAKCDSLISISVETCNSCYDSRDNCNAIIDRSSDTLMLGCKGSTIPQSVKSIGVGAFQAVPIESITIPSSVTDIGNGAFQNCKSLSSITCYPTVSPTLGNVVFSNAKKNGTLYYPTGSDYSSWNNSTRGLGKLAWTFVEF